MDILRKELNVIYESQRLHDETLCRERVEECRTRIASLASVSDEIDVITDASADCCYIYSSNLAALLGLTGSREYATVVDSSDEDAIYARMHPEDLPDKRMLEYEYFRLVDPMDGERKKEYKATCRIRIMDRRGEYVYVNNSTQVLCPSSRGKIWLILCRYSLSPLQCQSDGISPAIVCTATGVITPLSFADDRRNILTAREKEVLLLIKEGRLSKQIAADLGISINTVNRHRQNIIGKLSVNNSTEAVSAAMKMRLF